MLALTLKTFISRILNCSARPAVAGFIFAISLKVLGQGAVPGEYLVKFKNMDQPSQSRWASKTQGRLQLKASFGALKLQHLVLKNQNDQALLTELKRDPDVEYVEPNYYIQRTPQSQNAGELSPGFDSATATQAQQSRMSLDSESLEKIYSAVETAGMVSAFADGGFQQNGAPVHIPEAWSQMSAVPQNGSGQPIVAIIDSGIDYNHPAFTQTNSLWTNGSEVSGNGIDDDGNGFVDDVRGWNFKSRNNNPFDDEGHGTHVAGIVLGATQDLFATTLSPSLIKIMPLKFIGADGLGATSDAISAVYYAVNSGARVLSCSWGSSQYSQALHDALAFAYGRGAIIVAAAGNNGKNNDQTSNFPSNLPVPSLIAVAATNDYDSMASFSNFGKSTVTLSAPGVSIFSTYPNNQYRYLSGTSMSTPFVAGLVALALREAPQLSGYQIRNLVMGSVQSLLQLNQKVQTQGRVDANSLIAQAKTMVNTPYSQPGYAASVPANAGEVSRDVASSSASGKSAGCGLVKVLGDAAAGGPPMGPMVAVIILSALPLVAWAVLRYGQSRKPKRKYERFALQSEIKVQAGGRELTGQMKTISAGGLSFQADQMLEKGGQVTISISSPDGKESVQVQGQVVWSENEKSYGVQFAEARASLVSQAFGWARGKS